MNLIRTVVQISRPDGSVRNQEVGIRLIRFNGSSEIESEIHIDGLVYRTIYGRYRYGYYIVIPNFRIGCEAAQPDNCRWNRDSLMHAGMKEEMAMVISAAISMIHGMINSAGRMA